MYHTSKDCPSPQNVHSLPKYRNVLVDGGRTDKDKQKARPRNRGEKESTMLKCKVVGCLTDKGRQKRFRNATNANIHLKVFHKLKGKDYDAMAYPVPVEKPPAENAVQAAVATAPAPINMEQAGLPGADNNGASAADMGVGGLQSPPPKTQTQKRRKKNTPSSDESDETEEEEEEESEDEEGEERDDQEVAVVEPDEEYTAEAILADRTSKTGEVEYQIQWLGYTETTWQGASSFVGTGNMLELYEDKKKEQNEQEQKREGPEEAQPLRRGKRKRT